MGITYLRLSLLLTTSTTQRHIPIINPNFLSLKQGFDPQVGRFQVKVMNQEVATLRPNDYTSNNIIRKSEKVLNYPSNLHLKTEQERDQEHKSPEQGRMEFRQTTWRKPRMPYNKFPDAFQMRQKGKSIDKVIPDDYDKLVREREFQQVKKYLNPISLEKKIDKNKGEVESANPLAAYKRYLEMQKKFTKEFQEGDTLDPVRKSKPLSLKKPAASPLVKINECITLDVIKRGHNTGTIKKMLHVPTLQLMCVREQPTNTRQSRNSIKQWVNFWQTKLGREGWLSPFIKVHAVSFNYPEGAISILVDYFSEGSLLDLLEIVLTLPESVIRQVFEQVILNLRKFYDLTEMQFGGLSPSQILIDNNGEIKLGMGLYYHFTNSNSNSIYHIRTPQKSNIFQMNMTQKNFMKSSISQPANLEAERGLDIFKLGLVMLECAVGGFENYEQSDYLHQILKVVLSEEGQKIISRENLCCLIHSELYLIQWANREEKLKKEQLDTSKIILYMKLLKERFSIQFLNFLCVCLKLEHSKRATLNELMEHSFLRVESKDSRTVNLSLKDLMLIREAESDPFIESNKQERLDKFIGHMLQVLSNCPREDVVALLRTSKEKILGINKYIGVNYYKLGEKLYEAISGLIKTMPSD